ncbi:thiol reductant ABC exporter subunit CydC [Neomicrococcus aestuarii]|uniref:thiol reductant ABC exporter subunit CydC n=1 Tax=Neomicrococcus aestuarii TaxID=556325 RepID=UPI000A0448E3|nr:thiol reductant ABC exporter subunit CydC [Neomicrococcus aestuarii]
MVDDTQDQLAREDTIRARAGAVQRELFGRADVRRASVALAVLAVLKSAGLIGLMSVLAHVLARFAEHQSVDAGLMMVIAAASVVAQAIAAWGTPVVSRRASAAVAQDLRTQVLARRLASGRVNEPLTTDANSSGLDGAQDAGQRPSLPRSEGAEVALATRGLDALDKYFTDYLPALIFTMIVPVFVGVWILSQDWVSALIIALTTPLVPLFMILIGKHTAERVAESAEGLARMAHHLMELARGLPVLVGIRRAHAQRAALEEVSNKYRDTTMGTLRAAFTSSFALELIATISVAIVAVFIGVRLVHGDMTLEAGLLSLMLAPECFAALRNVGSAFHASEDGAEAFARATELAHAPIAQPFASLESNPNATNKAEPSGVVVRAKNLRVRYAQRDSDAVGPLSFELSDGESLALWGASGSGKSTLLHVIAGVIRADSETELSGTLQLGSARALFAGQSPRFSRETVGEELNFYAQKSLTPEAARTALLRSALTVDLSQAIGALSPGEQRRLAIARLLVVEHEDQQTPLYLLDEPTAHLDPRSAQEIRALISELAETGSVIAATHDPALAASLGQRLNVSTGENSGSTEYIAEINAAAPKTETLTVTAENAKPTPTATMASETINSAARFPWRSLFSRRFVMGSFYGTLAVLAAAALSAVSGWLIVYASQQPPIMYLLVAIVGVRFFGLSRSALKYLERLTIHEDILRWSTNLRLRLWDSLAGNIVNWKRLTHSGAAAERLIGDVDELRDVLPRAVTPIGSAVIAGLAMLITVGVLTPSALPAVVGFVLAGFLLLPVIVYRAERNASAEVTGFRTRLMGRYAAIQGAAAELAANGLAQPAVDYVAGDPESDRRHQRTAAFADGLSQAGVVVITGLAAVATALLCVTGAVDPRLAALSTLVVLALNEPLSQAVSAIRHWPTLQAIWSKTAPLLEDTQRTVVEPEHAEERPRVEAMAVNRLSARYPGMETSVFAPVSATLGTGQWWTVTGPSGSGKSTLIAVLLGFLKYDGGGYRLYADGTWREPYEGDAAALASLAWCPQEAHVFDSTIAGNLALSRSKDEALSEAEMTDVLQRVGLGPWLESLPHHLQTRTGAQGSQLSGGQRQRLAVARAILARSSVVILDEPTAHLGQDEGHQMIAQLRAAGNEHLWVMVTHDASLAHQGDVRSELVAAR